VLVRRVVGAAVVLRDVVVTTGAWVVELVTAALEVVEVAAFVVVTGAAEDAVD